MGASIKIKEFKNCSGEREHSRAMTIIFGHGELESKTISHVDHAFYFAGGSCPIHTHDASEEIFLFTRGKGVFHLDGKDYPYEPGSIFCVPRGMKHGLDCGTEGATEHVVCCVYT